VDGLLAIAPDAEVVGSGVGGTRALGYEAVQDALARGLTFDVILSINDAGSYGAIRALEEAGIPPDAVAISSIDAETLALRYIRQGFYFRASVEIGREQFSIAAVNSIIKLLAGASIAETVLVRPGSAITQQALMLEATADDR
jgi:ABC-type sugar transport system substrate-binding protein